MPKGLFSGALISSGFPETITGVERTASKTLVQISGVNRKNYKIGFFSNFSVLTKIQAPKMKMLKVLGLRFC